MLYGGDGAKYVMADRMREAERARLATSTRAVQEHRAKVRKTISAFVAVLSLPLTGLALVGLGGGAEAA